MKKTISELIKSYQEKMQFARAFQYALWMIGWDTETEAPRGALEERSLHVGTLSRELHNFTTSPETIDLIQELFDRRDELYSRLQIEIKKTHKSLMRQLKVPVDEYVEYQMLLAKTQNIWAQAKNNNDYNAFKPYLEKIISFERKLISYWETDKLKGYDVLLDLYEEGMTAKEYDEFFAALKKDLVPFVKEITSLPKREFPFLRLSYDIDKQKAFSHYIMDVMMFDRNRGLMKESEHPFTSGVTSQDVRWTNHFHEKLITSSIFSAIHELGHATYEQQCNPELDKTNLGGGASMAMHESQSRFYENIIGRSPAFWNVHFAKLRELFPSQLKDVTAEEWVKAVNLVENSLIRTEADELTYPLHIMVRYDMERAIMKQELSADELPGEWNRLMKSYLNIDVPSDKEGVLQDVHWSGGMFGYFPTYALGSAYAAQIYHAMKQDFDVDASLSAGNTQAINEWLKQKIHWHGATKTAKELIMEATNEPFNPKYYIDYLKTKYQAIYR